MDWILSDNVVHLKIICEVKIAVNCNITMLEGSLDEQESDVIDIL